MDEITSEERWHRARTCKDEVVRLARAEELVR